MCILLVFIIQFLYSSGRSNYKSRTTMQPDTTPNPIEPQNVTPPAPQPIAPAPTGVANPFGAPIITQPEPVAVPSPSVVSTPQFAQSGFQSSSPEKTKKFPKLLLIVGIVVVVLLIGVAVFVLTRPKGDSGNPLTEALNTVTGTGMALTNYTSVAGHFQMEIPKGATTDAEVNPSDAGDYHVIVSGPNAASLDTQKYFGKEVTIEYTHETDASQYSTPYADFLANVKEVLTASATSDGTNYVTTIVSQNETTVDGYKAYISRVNNTDTSKQYGPSTKTQVDIYVDNLTTYEITLTTDTTDSAFLNQVDAMVNSFKVVQ
jgi:hypothetical protein